MKDLSLVMKAVEQIINNDTAGYKVERNPVRDIEDAELPAENKAWVGILKGDRALTPQRITTGLSRFGDKSSLLIIVQVVDLESQEEVDEKLTAAEKEILEVLADPSNLKLPYDGEPTVGMIDGFFIDYESKFDSSAFYQAAIIKMEFSE